MNKLIVYHLSQSEWGGRYSRENRTLLWIPGVLA